MAKTRQRIPKLRFTAWRELGWHVAFRDKNTGIPRKHLFNIREREREAEARILYHAWILERLGGNGDAKFPTKAKLPARPRSPGKILSGSLIEIADSLITAEKQRVRAVNEPRRKGTIAAPVCRDRIKAIRDFLRFLNERYGDKAAVSKLRLRDLTMEDVEAFNRTIVKQGFSASQVGKRLQLVKAIINRGGRPEHGKQLLSWNWESRDVSHGTPTPERIFPTVAQIKRLLAAADLRGRTMIWLGLGLGLGARDLAAVRVGQITADAYDLRRSKTGVERYGTTPPLVWAYVSKYEKQLQRPRGQLLFVTAKGNPLVHSSPRKESNTSNAVTQWWSKLRKRIGEEIASLPGFYTLRHVGATEFGSRPGTSIGDVKRWLGHSAGSDMADAYMRPVRPEYRDVIEWVRRRLLLQRLRPMPKKRKSNKR